MEYKTANNTITTLARIVKYCALLITSLIVCNLLLGVLLWHQSGQEKTILVPTNLTKTAMVSDASVSANYLMQCALFFVDARLNVTPETIDADNQLVLSHTAPAYYANFNAGLIKESNLIKSQKISSVFYITNIKTDPQKLLATVTGTLKRWVGERALPDSKKQYDLHFMLNGNELFLTTFGEIKLDTGVSS